MILKEPALTADQVEANFPTPQVPLRYGNATWEGLKRKALPDDHFYWYATSSTGGGTNGYALVSKGCFVGSILTVSRKYHINHSST